MQEHQGHRIMGKVVVNTINQGGLSDRAPAALPVKTYRQSDPSRMVSSYGAHQDSILNAAATFKFEDGSNVPTSLTTDN